MTEFSNIILCYLNQVAVSSFGEIAQTQYIKLYELTELYLNEV